MNIAGLVEAAFELDVGRQGLLKFCHPGEYGVPHPEDVLVVLLIGRDEHSAMPVVAPDVAAFLGCPGNLRDVAYLDHAPTGRCDDSVGDFLQRFVAARGSQVVAPHADVDCAPGNAGVLASNRILE